MPCCPGISSVQRRLASLPEPAPVKPPKPRQSRHAYQHDRETCSATKKYFTQLLPLTPLGAWTVSEAAGAVLATAIIAAPQAHGETSPIGGAWSGGGLFVYSDGRRERPSCRAHYSGGWSNVSLTARCATPSGSIDQSANLAGSGPTAIRAASSIRNIMSPVASASR
jgi:hypothetical protein